MKYHVYILECADKTLYIGATNDLEKRVKEHNNSKLGAHYTKIRRPVKLVYFETFSTHGNVEDPEPSRRARRREAQLKKWTRAKKLALIQNWSHREKLKLIKS